MKSIQSALSSQASVTRESESDHDIGTKASTYSVSTQVQA